MKLPNLIALIRDRSKGAKHSLCEGGTTDSTGHGQNSLQNLRGETKHAHDLGYPGGGIALAAGEVRLVSALQLSSPECPICVRKPGKVA